jgi:hypothetical protein
MSPLSLLAPNAAGIIQETTSLSRHLLVLHFGFAFVAVGRITERLLERGQYAACYQSLCSSYAVALRCDRLN